LEHAFNDKPTVLKLPGLYYRCQRHPLEYSTGNTDEGLDRLKDQLTPYLF
jgi:hypothetical protein